MLSLTITPKNQQFKIYYVVLTDINKNNSLWHTFYRIRMSNFKTYYFLWKS